VLTSAFFVQLTTVFLAYSDAGKSDKPPQISGVAISGRSARVRVALAASWPTASRLAGNCGERLCGGAQPVSPLAALGQSAGATIAATTGALARASRTSIRLSRLRTRWD
jgi:hypothetical protein